MPAPARASGVFRVFAALAATFTVIVLGIAVWAHGAQLHGDAGLVIVPIFGLAVLVGLPLAGTLLSSRLHRASTCTALLASPLFALVGGWFGLAAAVAAVVVGGGVIALVMRAAGLDRSGQPVVDAAP